MRNEITFDGSEWIRENYLNNPSPDNNFESAVFLLSNSKNFLSVPEIEKEIKLGNFTTQEKPSIQSLLNSYQDLILLNDLQTQKFVRITILNVNF